jgi:hypothetical protein
MRFGALTHFSRFRMHATQPDGALQDWSAFAAAATAAAAAAAPPQQYGDGSEQQCLYTSSSSYESAVHASAMLMSMPQQQLQQLQQHDGAASLLGALAVLPRGVADVVRGMVLAHQARPAC